MIYVIIWWVIGVIGYMVGSIILDKELSRKDIFDSLYIGLLGIVIPIFIIYEIIRKKEYYIPQKYIDMWNKNLLTKKK